MLCTIAIAIAAELVAKSRAIPDLPGENPEIVAMIPLKGNSNFARSQFYQLRKNVVGCASVIVRSIRYCFGMTAKTVLLHLNFVNLVVLLYESGYEAELI